VAAVKTYEQEVVEGAVDAEQPRPPT